MLARVRRVWRGTLRRCANCGGGDLFVSWFRMRGTCPTCGFSFEREEGYWLGAMIVNLAVTEALFGLLFVGGMLLTWPDVPWNGLLIAGLVLNGLVPVAFYPFSKTIWVGIDLFFNPPSATEEAEAIAVLGDGDRHASSAQPPSSDA